MIRKNQIKSKIEFSPTEYEKLIAARREEVTAKLSGTYSVREYRDYYIKLRDIQNLSFLFCPKPPDNTIDLRKAAEDIMSAATFLCAAGGYAARIKISGDGSGKIPVKALQTILINLFGTACRDSLDRRVYVMIKINGQKLSLHISRRVEANRKNAGTAWLPWTAAKKGALICGGRLRRFWWNGGITDAVHITAAAPNRDKEYSLSAKDYLGDPFSPVCIGLSDLFVGKGSAFI